MTEKPGKKKIVPVRFLFLFRGMRTKLNQESGGEEGWSGPLYKLPQTDHLDSGKLGKRNSYRTTILQMKNFSRALL